jgi:hypothetical protein
VAKGWRLLDITYAYLDDRSGVTHRGALVEGSSSLRVPSDGRFRLLPVGSSCCLPTPVTPALGRMGRRGSTWRWW